MALFGSLFLALALCVPLSAQRKNDVATFSLSLAPYRIGELLTYNVSFSNFISAAHVELRVVGPATFSGREGLQLRAHVETTGVVNAALYSINNDYTSYIDMASGLPFHTDQVIREGARTTNVSAAALNTNNQADYASPTLDFLSAIYRLRALPLTEGITYRFLVRNDADLYDAELKVQGHEIVKTNVGSFNAIVTQLRVRNNSAFNNYQTRIYFSPDERHVPLLITARHPAGEIRAELAASELPSSAPTPIVATRAPVIHPTPNTVVRVPVETKSALPDGLPFKVGEQLNFNVFLGNLAQPVGTASFQVRARSNFFGREGLFLTATAQTTNAARAVFYASDQINSYVDLRTLLPFRTEMLLQEGTRRTNQTFTIDQDRGTATADVRRVEIPIGTHDIISIFYALRTFNIEPPKRNAVSILVHNRARTLFITALGRETITLNGQQIPAVQLSLTTDDEPGDKYSLRLWVSADTRRLPLRITANTQLGPVRADLAIIPVSRQ